METKKIEYREGEDLFEAFIAHPGGENLPGILLFPEWDGRNPFIEKKAEYIASLGYVGIALDVYGKGKIGKTTEEKMALMTPLIEDRDFLLKRILAGYEMAKTLPFVTDLAAMGFCFGGLCALDLARSGAPIKGAASIHGLFNPPKKKNSTISAKILALTGFEDPMVPPDAVLAFQKEMTESGADWQVHSYGNTMHAFTNPSAKDPKMGTMYHKVAEMRALTSLKFFFEELFQ